MGLRFFFWALAMGFVLIGVTAATPGLDVSHGFVWVQRVNRFKLLRVKRGLNLSTLFGFCIGELQFENAVFATSHYAESKNKKNN